MFECNICNKEFKSLSILARHSSRVHKVKSKELYDLMYGPRFCACGCGEETRFIAITKGYSKFRPGHYSRVHNNWGHNKNAKEKSLETRRRDGKFGFKDGHIPWALGLTKESDSRVMKMSETIKDRHGKRYSDLMKENRLNGTIPTLYGKDHPNWKGGTSSLNSLAHSSNRLYKEWKFPLLEKANFKCNRCKSSDELHVHHDKERMADIIKLHTDTDKKELSFDEKKMIVEKVIDHHIDNHTSGEILCEVCHMEEHNCLNFIY